MNFEIILDWLKMKITSEQLWEAVGVAAIKIFLIIVLSMIVVKVGKIAIQKMFDIRMKTPLQHSERRHKTILKLLQSIISYVVYFSAIVAILSIFDVKITGLLAGAGILGLAVGFGAQSLVKDVITGFFIIFEDQFGVGDYIRLTTTEGTVLEIGLRTTKLKGANGEIHIIPNGAITEVVNYSVSNSVALVDISVAYDADIPKAEALIQEYLETLPEEYEDLTKTPTLLGIQNVAAGEVTLRITAETLPMKHFGVARNIRRDIKMILDENGIDIPYPRMLVYQNDQMKNKANKENV